MRVLVPILGEGSALLLSATGLVAPACVAAVVREDVTGQPTRRQ